MSMFFWPGPKKSEEKEDEEVTMNFTEFANRLIILFTMISLLLIFFFLGALVNQRCSEKNVNDFIQEIEQSTNVKPIVTERK